MVQDPLDLPLLLLNQLAPVCLEPLELLDRPLDLVHPCFLADHLFRCPLSLLGHPWFLLAPEVRVVLVNLAIPAVRWDPAHP